MRYLSSNVTFTCAGRGVAPPGPVPAARAGKAGGNETHGVVHRAPTRASLPRYAAHTAPTAGTSFQKILAHQQVTNLNVA